MNTINQVKEPSLDSTSFVLLKRLRKLRLTLAATYPYSFRLGGWLWRERMDWAAEFKHQNPEEAAISLEQARDYSFLNFCETMHPKELDLLLAHKFFTKAPEYLLCELQNTVAWYTRESAESKVIQSNYKSQTINR